MWTIGGFAQDFIKRTIINLEYDLFKPNNDKVEVSFVTQSDREDPNAGLLSVIVSCPVKTTLHDWQIKALTGDLSARIGLPTRQWNVSECDIGGHMMFGVRFGECDSFLHV